MPVQQMIGELASRILHLARPVSPMGKQKRNSEIINSIIGLRQILEQMNQSQRNNGGKSEYWLRCVSISAAQALLYHQTAAVSALNTLTDSFVILQCQLVVMV